MDPKISFPPGVEINVNVSGAYAEIITPEAVAFVAKLFRAFGERREQLLERRKVRQAEFDRGVRPDFLKETEAIRNSDWTIAPQFVTVGSFSEGRAGGEAPARTAPYTNPRTAHSPLTRCFDCSETPDGHVVLF